MSYSRKCRIGWLVLDGRLPMPDDDMRADSDDELLIHSMTIVLGTQPIKLNHIWKTREAKTKSGSIVFFFFYSTFSFQFFDSCRFDPTGITERRKKKKSQQLRKLGRTRLGKWRAKPSKKIGFERPGSSWRLMNNWAATLRPDRLKATLRKVRKRLGQPSRTGIPPHENGQHETERRWVRKIG